MQELDHKWTVISSQVPMLDNLLSPVIVNTHAEHHAVTQSSIIKFGVKMQIKC